MNRVFLSQSAIPPLRKHLEGLGHTIVTVADDPRFGPGVSSHPDLRLCRMKDGSAVFAGDDVFTPDYPKNAAFCAVCLDRYLVHRLDITSPEILKRAADLGLTAVDVRQGYTKCSCVTVDGSSVITSDPGIYNALSCLGDVNVLMVSPGHVHLPGFSCGFIGGASGLVGNEVVFNGDLTLHPDHSAMADFISSRGKKLVTFPGYPLYDIGSIVEII